METTKDAFTKPLKLALDGFVEGLEEVPAGFFEPLVAFWRAVQMKAEGSEIPEAQVKRNSNIPY